MVLANVAAPLLPAVAQPLPSASGSQAQQAFERQWQAAQDFEIPEGIYVEYAVEQYAELSEDELRELARVVEGKPEHPLRSKLEKNRRRHEQGPDTFRYRFWIQNDGNWRRAVDTPQCISAQSVPYADTALTADKDSWELAGDRLTLSNRKASGSGDPMGHIDALRSLLCRLTTGLFNSGPLAFSPAGVLSTNDGGIQVRLVSEDGRRVIEITGRLEGGYCYIENSRVTRADDSPKWFGARRTLGEWKRFGLYEAPVASQMSRYDPASGRVLERYTLLDLRTAPPEEIKPLLQTPDVDGVDGVRGQLAVHAIVDERRGSGRLTVIGANGERSVAPLPPSARPRLSSLWVFSGWAIAGMILLALIVIRLRRGFSQA
ncbi:MAG: hypothetical protein R3B57_04305 [Phycisphaerales bacterium]